MCLEALVGAINKFGVDIGYVEGAVMAWAVLAPTNNPGPGLLAGTYVGATGSASVGARCAASSLRPRLTSFGPASPLAYPAVQKSGAAAIHFS
jgi:hypothetical protein